MRRSCSSREVSGAKCSESHVNVFCGSSVSIYSPISAKVSDQKVVPIMRRTCATFLLFWFSTSRSVGAGIADSI